MKNKRYWTNIYFWLLFLQNLFFFSSHASLNNFSPYLLGLGFSKTFTGFFMNINAFGLLFFVIFLGHYIENINKRIILLLTYFIELISYIFIFLFLDNIFILITFKMLASLSFAAGFTINANLAFNLIPDEKRTGGIALFGISGILSNPISAFLGEWIIKIFSYKYLFLLGAIFTFMAIVMTLLQKEEAKEKSKYDNHFIKVLKRKELWIYFIYGFILGGAFSIFSTFIPPLTVEKFKFSKLSLYFTSYVITAILFRIAISKKFDSINKKKIMAIAFFVLSLAMFNTGFLFFLFQLIITGMLYGFSHTILYPLLSSTVVKLSPEKNSYLANSIFITCYMTGSISVSTLLGRIGDILNISSIFISMGLIALLFLFSTVFIKN